MTELWFCRRVDDIGTCAWRSGYNDMIETVCESALKRKENWNEKSAAI